MAIYKYKCRHKVTYSEVTEIKADNNYTKTDLTSWQQFLADMRAKYPASEYLETTGTRVIV